MFPEVRPTQLAGIEINEYAQELASVVIWIGYLQWMYHNGFNPPSNPVLEPIETIRRMDAILDLSDPSFPAEPDWPAADFIVGNPPFLGGKLIRAHLGSDYVDAMFKVWADRVRPEADLCCYWFEKGRSAVEHGKVKRAGLLATQGIRGGANRESLKRIQQTGGIFFGVSDREWVLDGANVHVSMVGFDDGTDFNRVLDGSHVSNIHSNLSASADITQAQRLPENANTGFMGDTKGGGFDIAYDRAMALLQAPNPNGRPNSDVVTPWSNGVDVTRRSREMWIIDFGVEALESEAAQYEGPFEYLREHVFPVRRENRRESYRLQWWLHVEPRGGMRRELSKHDRYLATTIVSKHRVFAWMMLPVLPDHQLVAFARADDFFMGVLHASPHEAWARSQGTQVRERESGFRYTATTCFETFPFPEPTDAQRTAIAEAARELDRLRNNWLNPPEWTTTETLEFPGTVGGPWDRYIDPATIYLAPGDSPGANCARDSGPDGSSAPRIGTVKYPRTIPRDEAAARELKKRTLTNLYNQRPTWLDLAHRRLDEAVFAAYGWPSDASDDDLLAKLLALNLERAAAEQMK